jgi:hypothetical protein
VVEVLLAPVQHHRSFSSTETDASTSPAVVSGGLKDGGSASAAQATRSM